MPSDRPAMSPSRTTYQQCWTKPVNVSGAFSVRQGWFGSRRLFGRDIVATPSRDIMAPRSRKETKHAPTPFPLWCRFRTGSARCSCAVARERTLKLVPLTSLYSLDTVFNTSLVTTNHGWAVYDSLFGMNSKGEIKPQMAEGHTLSDDGRSTRSRCGRSQIPQWRARAGAGLCAEPETMGGTGDLWANDCAVHR